MALQTPEQYYTNEDLFGKYQFVPLTEIVNNMMLKAQMDDSIVKHLKRSMALVIAKDAVRELTRDVESEELAFEVTVPDSLVFPLPQGFVRYSGISLVKRDDVTGSFNLYPLDIDYNMHTSIGYLQDNNADILFDEDGGILEADSSNAIAHPYNRAINNPDHNGNQPTKDTSKYSKHGLFSIDERTGIIVFSSDLADKEVVIRYQSDGLESELEGSPVSIHKDLKIPIQDYIIWQYLSIKNNTSETAIRSARNKYLASRHRAVLARADITIMRISKAMESANKLF